MAPETFGKITLIHGDCMEYLRSLPDNAFGLAIVDPPYGKAQAEKEIRNQRGRFSRYNGVERTGGTWAAKYGTSIRDWDIAPSDEYFKELFRVSRNQIIWGGQLFQPTADKMFSYMAQADNF